MNKLLSFFLFFLVTHQAISQTETFDIATYTAPKDWKKETKEGVVIYTNINTAANSFCMLAIHASTASSGDAQKDFKNEWKDLAVTPYNAETNPKTETQIVNGWTAITGASPVKQDNIDSYIVLTVFSGFGKTASVLANLNAEAYLKDVDALLENIKLDKTVKKNLQTPSTVTANATGRTDKFGHMLFTLPKGWTYQKYSNGVIMKPTDLLPDHYLEFWILESKPFSGNLQQAMSESWADALKQMHFVPAYNGEPYNIITQKTSYRGWEYIRSRGAVKKDGSSGRYDLFLFVIKLNNRIERFAITGLLNIDYGSFSPYVNPKYNNDIEEMIFTSKFDDWNKPILPNGSLKGSKISGQYAGLKLGGGMLQGNHAVFFSNGQVYFREKFPTESFDGINTWIAAENNIRNWGTYSIQNGKGYMQFSYGKVPIRINGNGIIITTQNTPHNYIQVPSVDGAVIHGVYAFQDWKDNSPTITFTRDGKFIDNGALDILNHQTTSFFNITRKPGSGTYVIRNYTIIFNYSDGRMVQIAFPGLNYDRKNQSPSKITLSFNNDEMIRR